MDAEWARLLLWVLSVAVFTVILLSLRVLLRRSAHTTAKTTSPSPAPANQAATLGMSDAEITAVLDDIDEISFTDLSAADLMLTALTDRVGRDRIAEVDLPRRAENQRLAAQALRDLTATGLPLHEQTSGVPAQLRDALLRTVREGQVRQEDKLAVGAHGAGLVRLIEITFEDTGWWVVSAEDEHGGHQMHAYLTAWCAVERYDMLVRGNDPS